MLSFDRLLSERFNTTTAKAIPEVWYAFLREKKPALLLFKRDNSKLPISKFCNLEQYRPQFYSRFLEQAQKTAPVVQLEKKPSNVIEVDFAKHSQARLKICP